MTSTTVLVDLCRAIDEHRWDDLTSLLAEDFVCRYVHTGEEFDRDSWVRLNAEYPGFERMIVEETVGGGESAVARCQVTGRTQGALTHFAVATFVHVSDGKIFRMTELWTEASQPVPAESRPV